MHPFIMQEDTPTVVLHGQKNLMKIYLMKIYLPQKNFVFLLSKTLIKQFNLIQVIQRLMGIAENFILMQNFLIII